ncbi:MAG: 50S ribosome-binding GTPase [Planctomycetales bacterium]|nr:50S ribosome-binding GTPase [Planctomycetales bacterium]
MSQATRVAVLTAPGRSAVAVIAVEGPDAAAKVEQFFRRARGPSLREQPLRRILYGWWGDESGEDLVVCRREENAVEIQCHGGGSSVSRIRDQLISAGCEAIGWQQWVSDRVVCPLEAEAQVELSKACTLRTAKILLDQVHGALRRAIDEILEKLRSGSGDAAAGLIAQLLAHAELGRHLTKPWQVVLSGLPNVGKSSLINALVGYQRAIVFDRPGTTRDVVTAQTAAEGWPLRLSDTAGLHETTDELEIAGIVRTRRQLEEADLVLWVLDCSQLDGGQRRALLEAARRQVSQHGVGFDMSRMIVVANKIDLVPDIESFDRDVVATCAVANTGIDALLTQVASRLVPCPPARGAEVPFLERHATQLRKALSCCEDGLLAESKAILEGLLIAKG